VLVNGRRFVAGIPGESAVDLNSIPTDFIERVELLTGGASATYGSDAVAGVVNIILKKKYEGIAADVSVGESAKGDDEKKKVSITFGTSGADGRANFMGHFGYSKQGAVFSRDREASAIDQASLGAYVTGEAADMFTAIRPFYSSYAPQGRFFYGTGGSSYTYDAQGNPIGWSTNGSATLPASGYNRSALRTIAIPTERFIFAGKGDYAINANHSAFFEGNYASTQTKTKLEPFALGAEDIFKATGGQVPAEFLVNGVMRRNPIIPNYLWDRISDTDGDGARDYYFTRRLTDIGNRGNIADRDTFRFATGLKGNVTDKWDYEVFAAYGQTKEAQTSTGQVNVLNFRNALEAIPDDGDLNGNGSTTDAICRDANARAQGCVPISVFGYNSIDPAAAKYVNAPGMLATFTSQKLLGANVSGEPMQLPAGPLGVAAGFEFREEYARSEFDPLQQAGLNAGNAIPRTEGKFDVKEYFIETRIPLIKNAPFAKSLSFLGAVRSGDYSTVGSTLSWNAGLEWSPNSDFKVRATRALSTRAPNINELYSPPSQDYPTGLVDPCLGVTATSVGTKDSACRAATGVSQNIAANGQFALNQSDLQGVSGYNRGNPKLGAEEGKSWTFGVVVTPRSIDALKRFTFTADYFDIKIADAIVETPRQFALDQCYSGDAGFCSLITRRPTAIGANSAGSISYIDKVVSNSGGVGTQGVDLTATFSDKVGPGNLTARLAHTYVKKGYTIPLPGAEPDQFAGEIGAPKHRSALTLGYKWGAFGISTNTTYIGESYLDDQFLISNGLEPRSLKVGSKVYNDVQFTYSMDKKTQFYFGIDNLTNTKPAPIISGLPGNDTGTETNAGTYDPIGRRYYLGLRVSL
jgi:outer membrane receptor protein involved in Fe transport